MIKTAKERALVHLVAQLHSVVLFFLYHSNSNILEEINSLYTYPFIVYINPVLIFIFVESLFRSKAVKKTRVKLSESLNFDKSKSFTFTGNGLRREWVSVVMFFGTLVILLFLHGVI